ncbi:MAG: GIY-YIG nuclease family protein [Candidatus Omnitrophica bacterium]|nr:GIY-YIG nuclease family protein [Candidatus Omnitrophota bacterium]MDD5670483.1 GIY-YIG nuclease family protein [Candidatus Omnitrophota bacterium]
MEKNGYVYLVTNKTHSVLYTGVTSDLKKRIWEHREGLVEGFTKKYNATKLVYYEMFDDMFNAITREKQIKGWLRRKKNVLIESSNHGWKDLYEKII